MKTKLLAIVAVAVISYSNAYADVIYRNGNLNGTFQGTQISSPQEVTDSFTVANAATITSATVGLFVAGDAVPVSLTYSFGSIPFGTDFGSGVGILSNTLAVDNGDFLVFLSTFSLNTTLPARDFYFTLSNALSSTGEPVGWDINFGPSTAFFRNPDDSGSTPSEFFELDGVFQSTNPATVPEPASLAIFAGGLLGVVASRRRSARTLQ